VVLPCTTVPDTGSRDCPMCGGSMQLRRLQRVTPIPGNPKAMTKTVAEWVCPDCDYFEEDEEGSPEGS